MSTFDGWETQLYGDAIARPVGNELMHFRTKGSRNGVRRFQTESGEWTPLGLKERREREGWGKSRAERKAEKRVAKAEKKAKKAEVRNEKKMARKARVTAIKEKKRLGDISKLTDAELKKKIERVKMEQEYKEMTKSPLLKFGDKAVETILNYHNRKLEAKASLAKSMLENNRVKAEVIKAQKQAETEKYKAKEAKQDRKRARQEARKQKWDTKGGLALSRKKDLMNAKTNYRGTTIRGAIGKHANNMEAYRQSLRMNPNEVKKHQRAVELAKIALEKEREKTEQERQKTLGGRK